MAFATVWNYCVPLTIVTVAWLLNTGKAQMKVNECDVNGKSVTPSRCVWDFLCKFI